MWDEQLKNNKHFVYPAKNSFESFEIKKSCFFHSPKQSLTAYSGETAPRTLMVTY